MARQQYGRDSPPCQISGLEYWGYSKPGKVALFEKAGLVCKAAGYQAAHGVATASAGISSGQDEVTQRNFLITFFDKTLITPS